MDLIERYLQAVKFWLPRSQQDDVIAELSEDIHARVEEQESALGHPLSESEVEALLRRRGSPLLVANRYLPQEQLIGPLLFPVYRFAVKVATLCILIASAFGWTVALLSHSLSSISASPWPERIGSALGHLWTGWFSAVALITLIFAVLERTGAKTRLIECWEPRRLPPLRHPALIPRSSSAIELVVNLSIGIWWGANLTPPAALHFGTLHIVLAPVWTWIYWGMLLCTLAGASVAVLNLLRPWWTTSRILLRTSVDLLGGILFCFFLQAGVIGSMSSPSLTPVRAAAVADTINLWMGRFFPWAVAVSLLIASVNLWRLLRLRRRQGRGSLHTAVVA